MTEPTVDPLYPRELLTATRESLVEAGITPPANGPLSPGYLLDGDVVALLDALRAEGWTLQPTPVPATPVEPLPDGAPAPGADGRDA